MCVWVQVDDFTDVRLVIEAHPCHSCTGTGLAPATSVPELGSPLPHLHRNWAHPCRICTGTQVTGSCLLRSPSHNSLAATTDHMRCVLPVHRKRLLLAHT